MMISWLSQVSSPIRKLPCTKAVRVLSTFIIETRPNWALGLYPENQLLISKKMHSWNKHIYTNHQFLGSVWIYQYWKKCCYMLLLSSPPAPRNSDEGRILWLGRKHELQYKGHRAPRFFKLIQWPLFMPYCIPQSGALFKKNLKWRNNYQQKRYIMYITQMEAWRRRRVHNGNSTQHTPTTPTEKTGTYAVPKNNESTNVVTSQP